MNRAAPRFQALIGYFNDKTRVMMALFVILAIILFPYLSWALNREPPPPDWDKIVKEREGAFLDISLDLPMLAKSYRVDSAANLYLMARQHLSDARPAALSARRRAYQNAAGLACQATAEGVGPAVPPVLMQLAQNEQARVPLDGGSRTIMVKCAQFMMAQAQDTDSLIEQTSPHALLIWLGALDSAVKSGCTGCSDSIAADISNLKDTLAHLQTTEKGLIDEARSYIMTLGDGLNFGFLYSHRYEWLLHLTVISWVGVITAAFAQLVVNIAERKDTGLAFVYLMLRFITAPIIAVIFVATISYGLVAEPIALNHRPMFLIFAFATGYMSESFNLMLREGLNKLVPSFGINADKVQQAADLKAATTKILTRPGAAQLAPAPATLSALEQSLKAKVQDTAKVTEAHAASKLTY